MSSSRQVIFTFVMFFARVSHGFLLKPTAVSRLPQAAILSMVSMDVSSSSSASFSTNGSSNMVLDPLIVCGPSGVGKGTIIDKFMSEYGGRHHFGFTVSHTTRAPRPGEVDGIHYHFVTREEMESAVQANLFLEHAVVHGNLYGTSWKSLRDVQEQDKRCLLDIDVQGVQALKKQTVYSGANWKPRYIFVAPPSLDILLERLASRGTEDELSLKRRTAMAQTEVEYGLQKGNFDGIIINDDLDNACREFTQLVKDLYSIA